jgi:ADP-heptose:LPS heptosyltransferase
VTEIVTRHTGWPAAITVGEDDAFLKEQPAWEELIGKKGTVVFDNRPLPELCKELSAAGLFIGNDSGIAHLAAGLGIPSVVFFFSTDPAQWAPWVPLEQFSVIDLRPRPSEGNHCSGKKEE